MTALDLLGHLLLQSFHLGPHPLDDVERVRVRERPDADEDRGLAGEIDRRVVVLRAQHDVGHVAEAHHRAVLSRAPPVAGIPRTERQVGVGGQVDLDQRALGLAHRRQVVVGGERLADLAG